MRLPYHQLWIRIELVESVSKTGLIAVNAAILPLPLAGKPIEGLLFVQVKAAPLTAPVKIIALVVAALHNI